MDSEDNNYDVISVKKDVESSVLITIPAGKSETEERKPLHQLVAGIKEEYVDQNQDLTTKVKFEKDPVAISFPVVKREPEERNFLDQHVNQSSDLISEVEFEEDPVAISFPVVKREPEEEQSNFHTVNEEPMLEVMTEENEDSTESSVNYGKSCAVSSTQKFLVQQHITASKHQANKQLNSKQRQLFLTQPTTSNVRSEFNIDLCRSLISADIPLYKLKNKVFREFLEKYTQHTIPDESTLRKTYAPSIYDETIQKIRDEIKDSSIWVSIDETPDKEGRLVGNVVIGLLSEQYSERILLHCDVLEKCNNKTIVKLFNEAMGILWPKGIMYDNVLFFISDAAPYMVKAGQALSVVYPKLTHFTCVAHAFHRVAEVVRDNFPKVDLLISSVKKYFSKLPVELTC
ncbi:hypothetical protein ANN_27541 [Periplaneta americana]|uniref:DUF659 domain-containing protein n=1 Tax=Periplaneta americana TaxID=6978 RepID=A0ABQ8RWA1_PERAM|nr:hypothetical protein ANN_27541 [Periplaneta americana]